MAQRRKQVVIELYPGNHTERTVARTGSRFTRAINAAMVWDALSEVTDPEVGINIVDLGLIHTVEVDGRTVRVQMTMATPGCPMSGMLADEVERVIAHRFPGHQVDVDVVWQPPWQPNLMSPIGRQQLQFMRSCSCGVVPTWQGGRG